MANTARLDEPEQQSTRLERRKAQTRGALIGAAQRLMAEGRVDVSIQQVTETADVGFGSFYNHFKDKTQLFDAAALDALGHHGEFLQRVTRDLQDPAEVFCVGLRVSGRLARTAPELARVAVQAGTRYSLVDEGLAYFARRDFEAAFRTGRFDLKNVDLALAAAGGALLGLMSLLDSDPSLDAEVLSDALAERVLRALGVPADEAADVVARPLPDLAYLAGQPAR
jgi:AcrR family transcriptional regulator